MIQDALLILWDCSQRSDSATDKFEYADAGDDEIYKRIKDVAKSHHRIQTFIENTGFRGRKALSTTTKGNAKIFGLYTQALSEGLMEVIQSYKKALVEVEGLVIGNHNYTLSFVYSYVEKFHGLFNILNKIIRTIEERKLIGCQIISIIHQYILNSNERVHEAIVIIFSCINKVFINQLCTWLLYGELRDPYHEFIIQRNQGDESSDTILSIPSTNNTCDRSLVTTLQDNTLECGYTLNPNMIPYFMPLSLAQEILFIGKTIILFGFDPKKVKKSHSFSVSRTSMPLQKCNIGMDTRRFTIWEDKEAEFHDKLQLLKSPEVFEVCNLRSVIREIKECVTKHLWTVAVEEAELLHELKLMKDFYLLGRGELFLELLRLTAPMLDKPTTRTSTRDMNHAFQLAARAMLLGNSADIEKFSFEQPYVKPNLSTNSPIEDDINTDGWSSIILKYDFKWPLHLLFTPEVLARYNDMFRLLLRMKKTQHDLHALWKTYKQASSFSMCQLHNKLMFLMDNLQHYMQADVLETNFSRLMDTANKTNDFEKLKKAHANFLADILSQSFLTITSSAESDCSGDTMDSINNPVFCNIMELIQLCNSFCSINEIASDKDKISYYLSSYSERFNKLVKQLMQLLVSLRDRPCGVYLARLLMRLDFNRWLSQEAQLTQSVTNMLRY